MRKTQTEFTRDVLNIAQDDLSTATGNGFSFLANIDKVLIRGFNTCYRLWLGVLGVICVT
ncbi:MAG: hypothetical protein QNJ55_15595 [Xenococcus sp. MO_188.B8]|nr:hypothetical protein [Xenococcus sp. MO_188.B8]